MDYRGVLLGGVLCAAGLAGASTSCSSPDPGEITFSERPKTASDPTSSGGSPTTDGGGTTGEGGASEAGVEGGVKGDPVFGTTTFAAGPAGPPVNVAKAANAMHMGDASGKDCIVGGCHLNARPWYIGGTLFTDAAGTARSPATEVRVTGPDGKVVLSTYSDVDGNFWFEGDNPKIPANSRVGVRIAGKFMDMSGSIGGEATGGVGCSNATGCHGAASPGRVFIKP